MQKAKIVVVGSINMDLVVQTNQIPVPGETLIGQQFAMVPGGKGANQAVAAARLGAEVTMIACVGDDLFGTQMLERLNSEGIDTSHIKVIPQISTGIAAIQIVPGGDNSIIVVPGANMQVTPEQVEEASVCFQGADIVLVQLEIPLPAVAKAIELARRYGVRTILNPAPARELPRELLQQIDVITPNETEASILTRGKVEALITVEERLQEMKQLVQQGDIMITHGAKGIVYDIEGQQGSFPAYQVKVVDTTAAGDSFNAGIAVRWGEGSSLTEAVAFATKVAAITVTRFGAQTSLPTREEVENFDN
ncbi:Ribokinase [compost metagenome]